MTRLACFYTNLDSRTKAALEKYAPAAGLDVEWAETPGPGMAYAGELEKRWTGEEDLILVEQDKEIFPSTLQEIASCAHPWCTCTCWVFPEPHTKLAIGAFGVTKFSAEIQRAVKVSEFAGDCQMGIDARFGILLREKHGIGACLHSLVLHHHVYEPRPEFVRRYVEKLRQEGTLPPAMYPKPPGPHLLPGSYDLG